MAPARFSAFELLLLKSRYPPDTASLLLLAWVYVSKRIALAEDQRYLEVLANGYRHSQDLDTLLEIARADLTAIQLAAEVVLRERVDEQAHPFLRRAIGLATSEGELSLRNHHILRFLSDLSGVTPGAFARLFREVTGRPLTPPGDPSRQDYWQQDEIAEPPPEESAEKHAENAPQPPQRPHHWQRWRLRIVSAHARRRESRLERDRLRQQARQRAEKRRQEEERLERERQAEAQRQEQARQADARRQDQERQAEDQRREQARQEEAYRQEQWRRQQWQQATGAPQPHYRVRLALQVLELEEHASPIEIKRAYRRLAQRHHPDRFHGQGDLRVSLASQRFQRIKNAYDYLMTTT